MSRKNNASALVRPPVVVPPVLSAPAPASAPEPPAPQSSRPVSVAYDFGHTRRCPECGSLNTWLDGVSGRYGHRRCQNVHCRHRWKVVGQKI